MGRIGGLAVALGIGAAIFSGQSVALADDGASSGSEPSTSTSSVSSAPSESSEASGQQQIDHEGADADAQDQADVESAVEQKRSHSARDEAAGGPEDFAEPADDAVEPEVTDLVADPVEVEPADEPTEVVLTPTEPAEQVQVETEVPEIPEEAPVKVASAVISNVVGADSDVDRGDKPADPADAALALTLLATARKEAEDPTAGSAALQTANSLAVAETDEYPIPTDVVVALQHAPLEWLQRIPVLGPWLVTPIVRLLHAIPLVGEFLHPLIGFPVDHDAAEGTPAARSVRVTSFDGTQIYVNFMPATGLKTGESAPTVLSGPGLGLPGATTLDLDLDGLLPNDVIGIGELRKAGYNVVTWDPRGEWRSGGRMQLESPDFEGRDLSHIISWLSTLSEVDSVDGDPKIGMVGASYGGGIQLAAAAVDRRIDAIVPTIAWNSLNDVLFPREAVSSAWGTLLSSVLVLTLARPNPRILPAAIVAVLTGFVSQDDKDLLADRSYADDLGGITAPTLLIQGTVDTLFTLAQADANAKALIDAGTTTKVVWYCGGHGACLSTRNDGTLVRQETLEWLNRYVKGDETVVTGPQFEWVDQHGEVFSSQTYPVAQGQSVDATLATGKTIPFFPFIGGSGPNPAIITRFPIGTLLGLPSAAPALNAVNLRVPDATETTNLVGAPELTLTYSGTGNGRHVYAQLVDDETGLVLGNQATPIPVVLDGESHTVTLPMEQVAHTLKPGESVTVQLVTSVFTHLNFYSFGVISVQEMSVKLPTLAAGVAAQDSGVAA
ncbi:hypothetical protein NGTWS1803_22460 [Mycolicibacterium cyprinidarum]|nr:hypothetical protein NGTWS1803_22460 [Mycolicibacterium sp. NGTWS1803]